MSLFSGTLCIYSICIYILWITSTDDISFIFQTINQSKSRYGLDTKPTSSFYPFVRVYADLQIVDSADNEFLVLPDGSE